jgi:hypothetical protein
VHSISDGGQIEEIQLSRLCLFLVLFGVKFAIAKFRKYKLPASDQILADLIKQEVKCSGSEI